jgi:hypothetical protein
MSVEVSGTRTATRWGGRDQGWSCSTLPAVTGGCWPLVVAPQGLIPATRTAGDDRGTIHLHPDNAPATAAPGLPTKTLCGRRALSLGVEVDLDVLGSPRAGWRPPGPDDGEDHVVAWLVETVLNGGSAMIDDVPFGRVRRMRQRVTRQIKATIGGTVTTATISPTTILVHSALVIDAKTEDQQQRELHDGMLRLWTGEAGLPLGQPDWRRRWSQLVRPPDQ